MSSLLRRLSRSPRRFGLVLPLVAIGLFSTLCLAIPAHAAANDEVVPTPEALAELELRANQANPREQCFLYTELVHSMTIKAGQELSDGDTDQAAVTLKQVNRYEIGRAHV